MVEVSEKFIESVYGREEFVQVTQMVFSELSRGITLCFQRSSQCAGLCRKAHISTSLTYRGHSCAKRQFTSNKICATSGTTCFSVIVGETHSARRQLVQVGRFARHDALVITAQIEPAYIVAHDNDNIGFLLRMTLQGE